MTTPDDRRYSGEHEWAFVDGNNVTVGVTRFATDSLGDVVYVDLPESGTEITQFEKFGEIESVKAVSDLLAPIGGTIVEINSEVIDMPEKVNEDPYSVGWLLKVEVADADSQLGKLMDAAAYDNLTAE
ncbi:MAG TPA: glycine cleavage system protein GcvH [Dehalococcoidia bacterium]|jgi:glycine cleavage system H protein|nr:glycine cleavage system protein H [Chloroflexota bacterium]MDP5877984.1 glycine cleavage system protein GcvH [Dehalococcoidia bacterium]MDP6272878.1 glycine cleavage system protein GcvH [Dehalococcoidia bacterium]MDP7161706.1 glycine cleavage system protein GcvH [Dehalococcoidia bacterium]MDP7213764.1 glycine cleavage system protein GcvH [Dehalococcoidia bacterium]|tara:strand:- start:2221 stop:2604 length:384 start_codon:yes stop_codon:yes gene_type:complete